MTPKTWIHCGLLLIGLAGILACDNTPPPPKTYPVKGKVVFNEGGAPSDGLIEFRSVADSVSARGKVEPDGSFSLTTIANNKTLQGTIEGEHAVTYIPGVGKDAMGQSNLPPVNGTEKVKVKADGGNDFTIKLARPKAR